MEARFLAPWRMKELAPKLAAIGVRRSRTNYRGQPGRFNSAPFVGNRQVRDRPLVLGMGGMDPCSNPYDPQ